MVITVPAPKGIVKDIVVRNTSDTSVNLSWLAPPINEVHGKLVGYRIKYKEQEKSFHTSKEISVQHPLQVLLL